MEEFEYDYPEEDLFDQSDEGASVGDAGPVGRAESADGLISVTLRPDGRVQDLVLDPTIFSRGADVESTEFAEQIKTAINEAFADLAEQHAAAAAADREGVGAKEKAAEFARAMDAMKAEMASVEERLARR